MQWPKKDVKILLKFTADKADALMHALMQAKRLSPGGGAARRPSTEKAQRDGKAAILTPVANVRLDQVAHWPKPSSDKNQCRLCQSYSLTTCE